MLSPAERRAKINAVIRVSAGNFLEMYDFIIYGYYARYIADTFFPGQNEFLRLMLSLMTFGAGFLMRPFGAVVLGAYMDRVGRRKGLLLALALMGAGTLSIAVTPGYAQIGLIAPFLIIAGRLLQGFSAGVQIGGCSVYLAEIATPGNRGFYCSWQSGSQQVAVMLSAALGVALTYVLPPETMAVWGWRVPILIGCLIVPLVFWLRHSLEETEEFANSCPVQSSGAVMKLLSRNWQIVVVGAMLSILTTTTFYLITVYTPTFGSQVLHLDPVGNMLVTLCVGLSNFIWLPIGGALSDRIGRRPLLFVVPMAALVTAYPAMLWLVADPSFGKLLAVELWFSVIFGLYNGAMIPMLAEIVPAEVRAAAFALAYSLATAIFGGFTPAVSTYLVEATGNRAAPALWLSLAAAISLTAAILSRRVSSSAAMQTAMV
ncbi:MAG TPA: MFS transporter [Micropepsaceae bacterium]|nr:MFS transporter [Micropepsaceae bacterium]